MVKTTQRSVRSWTAICVIVYSWLEPLYSNLGLFYSAAFFGHQNSQDFVRMRSDCSKSRSFLPIAIVIVNQTIPPLDLDRFDSRGEGGVTFTQNKRGCAILTKKVVPKNPGTYLKLRPKNPGTRNAVLSFYVKKCTTQSRKSLISTPHLSVILSKNSTI